MHIEPVERTRYPGARRCGGGVTSHLMVALTAGLLLLAAGCNGDDIGALPEALTPAPGTAPGDPSPGTPPPSGGAEPSTECAPAASIGDLCGGGIVYENNYNGPGVILIAALADEGILMWKDSQSSTTNANDLTDGRNNTGTLDAIHHASFACFNKTTGGFSDWYLPAPNEAALFPAQSALIGGFITDDYWTSAQESTQRAYAEAMPGGSQTTPGKTTTQSVRCIRRPA